MSLRLGRITGLPEPISWSTTGDRNVSLIGSYKATSIIDGLVKRDQILGLANNLDEPVIPVVMDNEPRVNGYYRVLGAQFVTDKFTRLAGNLYEYRVDLEAVQGFTQPMIEVITSGALLTNAVGAVAGDMYTFQMTGAGSTEYFNDGAGSTTVTRTGSDGVVQGDGKGAASSIGHYSITPVAYYNGACSVSQGSPLQPVVGRQMVQADTTNWQISNSLVRVAPNAAAGGFDISTFVATWKLKTYAFGLSAGAGLGGVSSVMVLRNSPEECSIRIASGGWFANTGRTYIDIALRRGDRLARFYVSSDVTNIWQIRRSAAEAGSAITFGAVTAGGIVATAADGNGEKYVMLSYQAVTVSDLVNGKLTLNATGKTMDFAIGSTTSGSGAPDNAVSLAGQYLAAQCESQRVVSR